MIAQIRALSDFMTLSTHRQGLRVIVIYPAESLNSPAANALLKSLEEPGPGSVFILVSHSPDMLLPTIISRCHQFALPVPGAALSLSWLKQQQVSLPEQFLAEQGGAPLAALAASRAETQDEQQELLRYLQRPSVDSALKIADKLQKTAIPLVVSCMQRWLYDVFSTKLTGSLRYYPRYQHELTVLAARISLPALMRILKTNNQRRAVAEHPLSARLLIEEMLLEYCAACHEPH